MVTKAGKVLAIKPNIGKNNPLHCHYTRCSTHAEVAALKVCGSKAKGSVLYVARLGGLGTQLPAKPCARCTGYIKRVGVKRVVYTTNEGIESCRTRQMDTLSVS